MKHNNSKNIINVNVACGIDEDVNKEFTNNEVIMSYDASRHVIERETHKTRTHARMSRKY